MLIVPSFSLQLVFLAGVIDTFSKHNDINMTLRKKTLNAECRILNCLAECRSDECCGSLQYLNFEKYFFSLFSFYEVRARPIL